VSEYLTLKSPTGNLTIIDLPIVHFLFLQIRVKTICYFMDQCEWYFILSNISEKGGTTCKANSVWTRKRKMVQVEM